MGLDACTCGARDASTVPGDRLLPKGLPLNATYGAPEPTHGSPAIMVRMSVRHCVEIFSRGDGVRRNIAMGSLLLQKAQNAAAAHPAVCYTPSPHHSCTAGSRSDHGGALAGAP